MMFDNLVFLPPRLRFVVGAAVTAMASLSMLGCGGGLGSTSRPGLAQNRNHPGATASMQGEDWQLTAASQSPIPLVDFDLTSMSAIGVPGDSASINSGAINVFNGNSKILIKGFHAEWNEPNDAGDATLKLLTIDQYGGNRDALFAQYASQVDALVDQAKKLSGDQLAKFTASIDAMVSVAPIAKEIALSIITGGASGAASAILGPPSMPDQPAPPAASSGDAP